MEKYRSVCVYAIVGDDRRSRGVNAVAAFSSITSMYETAKPPHFLQIHMGDIEQADIDAFNESFEGVTYWQTAAMIDLYGDDISVTGDSDSYTLSDCRLNISLVKQNEVYDVLLDEKRTPLDLTSGQIGVPMIILDQYDIFLGDQITVSSGGVQKRFTAAAYVYDGMMNSIMCSSTRFLISDEDFDTLLGNIGETILLKHILQTARLRQPTRQPMIRAIRSCQKTGRLSLTLSYSF